MPVALRWPIPLVQGGGLQTLDYHLHSTHTRLIRLLVASSTEPMPLLEALDYTAVSHLSDLVETHRDLSRDALH